MKIKIHKTLDSPKNILHQKATLTLKPGITVLIGCNGSGKTHLINEILRDIKTKKIPFIFYDNTKQGACQNHKGINWYENTPINNTYFYNSILCSEGEKIEANLVEIAQFTGQTINLVKKEKENTIFLLYDAIGSGYSIDQIMDLKEDLFKTIIKDTKKSNIETYIIIASNEYEFSNNETSINVNTLESHKFNNYEDYKQEILKTTKYKKQRLKKLI